MATAIPIAAVLPKLDSTGLFSIVLFIPHFLTFGSLTETGITAGPELSGLAACLAANPGLTVLK